MSRDGRRTRDAAYYKEELRRANKQLVDLQQHNESLRQDLIGHGEEKKELERTIRKLKGQQQRGTIPQTTATGDGEASASGRDHSRKKAESKTPNDPVNVAIEDLQKIDGFHDPTRRQLQELKDMISTRLTPASEATKRQTTSGSCSTCADLQSKLDKLQEDNSKLVAQMNAEMKISQGDLGQTKDTVAKQYVSFFSQEADSLRKQAVRYSSYEKTEDKVKLCATFKRVHDTVQQGIVSQLQAVIQTLFRPGATGNSPLKDLARAYARLLVSQNLTGPACPMKWSQKIITAEIQKGSTSLTIQKAISLSWKLATAVPPMIATTDYPTFDERIHEQIAGGSDVNIPKGGAVRYVRPVLYGSCKRDIMASGLVT